MDRQAHGKGAVSLNCRSTRGVHVPIVQEGNSISKCVKLVRMGVPLDHDGWDSFERLECCFFQTGEIGLCSGGRLAGPAFVWLALDEESSNIRPKCTISHYPSWSEEKP